MTTFELEEAAGANGRSPTASRVAFGGTTPSLTSPRQGEDDKTILGTYTHELTGYYAAVRTFADREPDEVMLMCSSILGRLTEMRAECQRRAGARYTQIRTREIDPLMHDLRIQFDIHSRLLSVRELDYRMSKGQ